MATGDVPFKPTHKYPEKGGCSQNPALARARRGPGAPRARRAAAPVFPLKTKGLGPPRLGSSARNWRIRTGPGYLSGCRGPAPGHTVLVPWSERVWGRPTWQRERWGRVWSASFQRHPGSEPPAHRANQLSLPGGESSLHSSLLTRVKTLPRTCPNASAFWCKEQRGHQTPS